MAYCGPLGIPHSKFKGWREDDQSKAIAWLAYDKGRCPGCSTFPHEYLDQEGRMLQQPPFVVYSEICYGCVAIKEKQKEIGETNLGGISLRMVPNPKYRDE